MSVYDTGVIKKVRRNGVTFLLTVSTTAGLLPLPTTLDNKESSWCQNAFELHMLHKVPLSLCHIALFH